MNSNPEQQVDTWLKVMDLEGIDTAVCFPTSCGKLAYLQETSFAAAVARACNNHLAEEFGAHSKRMKMVGVLPIQDPLEAAKELRRGFTELGLVSFVILPLILRTPLGDPV